MERSSKKELLLRIEEQEKSLLKYKTRLHDVVGSYKNLIKEKEALEASVKVLTEANDPIFINNPNVFESEDNASGITGSDVSDVEDTNAIDSLKTSLRTLVEEKTRIENELKAHRKMLLKEKMELEDQLHHTEECLKQEKKKFETSVQELKKQIRDQQRDRDKEQEDHVLMLKELQSLVADERSAKEKLEQQADNLKLALEKLPDKRYEYESRIHELQHQLGTTRDLLQVAEGEKRDMPSLLRQLQQEMNEMKFRHQEAVEREIRRANEAEEKLKTLAKISEERAENLELRLSELSQMVGNYDKLRQQDQIAIHKLKDRVSQLDQENVALAKAVAHTDKKVDVEDSYGSDIHVLVERINKLKGSLRVAYQKSKKSSSVSDYVNETLKDDDLYLHAACQKEISKLNEEIEEYKLQIQSTKTKNSVDTGSCSEINTLKQQITTLQEELQIYKSQLETAEIRLAKSDANVQHYVNDLKSNCEKEKNTLQSEFQMKIFELEKQLQKQRERSLKLIEDKDSEISILKSSASSAEEKKLHRKRKEKETSNKKSSQSSIDNNELSSLLSNAAVSSTNSGQLLHYNEEIARNNVEISTLRRARLQVETELRELQQASLLKEENFQSEIDLLQSQIKRLDGINKGINMEYLKNVFLRYIQSNDTSDQSHMINAIAAILHFTPQELRSIKMHRRHS